MSAADLIAVLLAEHLRYDFTVPGHPGNDPLIFSKGHASPLLYAMYRAAGVLDDDELLSFRALGSRLEGHPTPRLPWVDVATGSLGLGLPAGVGKLAVHAMPGSATPDEQLHAAGIDAKAIEAAARALAGDLVAP